MTKGKNLRLIVCTEVPHGSVPPRGREILWNHERTRGLHLRGLLLRITDGRQFRRRQANSLTLRQLEDASVPSVGNALAKLPHVDRVSGDPAVRPDLAELLGQSVRAAELSDELSDLHAEHSNGLLDCLASGEFHNRSDAIQPATQHPPAMPQHDLPATQMKADFGARLKLARMAMGYPTATALAEAIDEDENVVSSWERGTRYPRPEKYPAITRALNVTIDYLFLGEMGGLTQQMLRLLTAAERNGTNGSSG